MTKFLIFIIILLVTHIIHFEFYRKDQRLIKEIEQMKDYNLSDMEILIKISEQKLYLINNNNIVEKYDISSSANGLGNEVGSYKTPLGKHEIYQKIGKNTPKGTIFKSRENTNRISNIYTDNIKRPIDDVTSRIIRLNGLEDSLNGNSLDRFIYIHGTPEEGLIGQKVSQGCIRMRNDDVIELFEKIEVGTIVNIIE